MKEKIEFYYTEKGAYAPKDNLPFVRRHNIAAIVKYNNEYLFLSWNNVGYEKSLITGGIDDNEDKELAVIREVSEETGYYDFKKITKIDCINVSKFYVEHKNENREAIYYPYLVELNSLKQHKINDYEQNEHRGIWISKEKLNEINLFENHRKMLEKAL